MDKLVEELSTLSVLDMAKLKKALEDKWGVQAAAPMAFAPAAGAAAAAPVAEATEFEVILDEVPADKKIGVIKVVREVTGLGLKEAKELVEGAPKSVKKPVSKAEAETIVKQIKDAGGKASQKGL
ncbi:MAG: 50S ribosomal protein L7/L12 [Parachlamydiales bacterium]